MTIPAANTAHSCDPVTRRESALNRPALACETMSLLPANPPSGNSYTTAITRTGDPEHPFSFSGSAISWQRVPGILSRLVRFSMM